MSKDQILKTKWYEYVGENVIMNTWRKMLIESKIGLEITWKITRHEWNDESNKYTTTHKVQIKHMLNDHPLGGDC